MPYDRDRHGREVLYIAEIEKPSPAAGEVLVEVKAAGINPRSTVFVLDRFEAEGLL
jgi:NADPH:quinone reductase-like Zn-dependent oxidoreductase